MSRGGSSTAATRRARAGVFSITTFEKDEAGNPVRKVRAFGRKRFEGKWDVVDTRAIAAARQLKAQFAYA